MMQMIGPMSMMVGADRDVKFTMTAGKRTVQVDAFRDDHYLGAGGSVPSGSLVGNLKLGTGGVVWGLYSYYRSTLGNISDRRNSLITTQNPGKKLTVTINGTPYETGDPSTDGSRYRLNFGGATQIFEDGVVYEVTVK